MRLVKAAKASPYANFYSLSTAGMGLAGLTDQWSSGLSVATETADSGSIPGRVKPKTIKIDIHSFSAWCSAIKGTMCSLHRV